MSGRSNVNDSIALHNAIANCAICTIAGLYGKTYSRFLEVLQKTDQSFGVVGSNTVEKVFVDLACQWFNVRATLDNATELQIRGIAEFFRKTGMRNVTVDGTVDRPLTGNDLMTRMIRYPVGTCFAILIGESVGQTHFAGGAHWIAGRRRTGPPALEFIDYQLDIPTTDPVLMRGMARAGARGAPLGSPGVTNVPMRAWGQTPKTALDRFVFIAFSPPN